MAGLRSGVAADLDYDEARLREESGLLDGVSTIGTGSLLSRIWTKPSITTIGIDAPTVATSSNTLVPSAAAKISMRLAPDENDLEAFELLRAHLVEHTPVGREGRGDARRPRAGVRGRRAGARSTTRPARPSTTHGESSRSTSGSAGRSRSSRPSPSSSRMPRSSSPGSRTPTHGRTAPTSRCTSASSRRSASPRPCCSPGSAPCPGSETAGHVVRRQSRRSRWLVARGVRPGAGPGPSLFGAATR